MSTDLLKARVHQILEPAGPGDRASRICDYFLLGLIALNVLAVILESVEPVRRKAPDLFLFFEYVSVAIFSIEYVLRVWSATTVPEYRLPVRGRIRFVLSPLPLLDLFAILPSYLPLAGIDFRSLRAVRLLRVLRLAKLARYSAALRTFGRVFTSKKEELLTTVLVLSLLLVLASTLMYFAEHQAQPETFSSIPQAMWWAVVTLTTVGYGDPYPVTIPGRLLGALIAVLGIGVFALPTSILGSAFVEELQARRKAPATCPHCGKEIRR